MAGGLVKEAKLHPPFRRGRARQRAKPAAPRHASDGTPADSRAEASVGRSRDTLRAPLAAAAWRSVRGQIENSASPRLERIWAIGRVAVAMVVIVAAQLLLRGDPAYWVVVGTAAFTVVYGSLFLAFLAGRGSLAVLMAGLAIDNAVLLASWSGYLYLNRSVLESNDLYLIMVPFVLFGIVRVGWLMGAAMAAFWLAWLAWTALHFFPSSSYDVTQLPIRLMVIGVIFLLALRLVAVIARERQLERSRIQHLSDLERFQTALVRSISHELRTPLTSARLYAELLSNTDRGHDPQALGKAGRGLDNSLRRLERIVERATEYGETDSATPVETSAIDLASVTSDAVERFRSENGGADRTIDVRVAEAIPLAQGNSRQLERVLMVLLDNAARYSPPGSAIGIEISADEFRVRVAVSDQGGGLQELDRKFLFNAFFRGSLADRHRTPGVGLGLALARQLVERQGGEVGISDEPGRTAVYMALPRSDRPPRD